MENPLNAGTELTQRRRVGQVREVHGPVAVPVPRQQPARLSLLRKATGQSAPDDLLLQ